jgi:hypothetical protein
MTEKPSKDLTSIESGLIDFSEFHGKATYSGPEFA